MKATTFKQAFHNYCIHLLNEQISAIQLAIGNQKEGSEGSSSAGDKHNTEQAMQHLELEKKQHQLNVAAQNLKTLQQIQPNKFISEISLGAFTETNQGTFYFSCALGKIIFQNKEIMVLSLASPLGQILKGKKAKAEVSFNGKVWKVLEVE